jgi:nitrogen fixation protein NifB
MIRDISKHPCFNAEVKRRFGRIHLPVAPKCNVQCNFCNRKYDCVNESRPGVTSAVLSPQQALYYLKKMYERDNRLTVVGIAGPGDTFANPDESLETMRLIREEFPEMLLCVSTNGLAAPPYIDALAEIGITHLTVTVNAVAPEICAKIYAWVRDGIKIYRGTDAAKILMERQFETIRRCHEKDIVVKINSILIPGVNDEHVTDVAKTVSQLGANLFNCIPMFPVAGTEFETIPPPDSELTDSLRADCGKYLPQMLHCTRCRADAVGCLGDKVPTSSIKLLQAVAAGPLNPQQNRPFVAVASYEGLLVNEHLGRARYLWIYGQDGDNFKLIETRQTPPGGGDIRWRQLGGLLRDCKAVLVAAAGPKPTEALNKAGVKVIIVDAIIDQVLRSIYNDEDLEKYKPRAARACSGGSGCA